MYLCATVQGQSHIWRQHFPEGEPEQITSGPTEEDGIAVDPSGGSLITSLGVHESAIWIHDPRGERSLSSEGEVLWWPTPVFGPDDNVIYYLLSRSGSSNAELWRTIVDSGKSEPVVPGIPISAFDISPDGKQVVYTTSATGGAGELWVAAVDRSSPATKVNITGAQSPRFGGQGQILFQHAEGAVNFLEQINPDGTRLSKVLPYPILDLHGISPGRKWVTVDLPKTTQDGNSAAMMVVPLDGGAPRRLCVGYCVPTWSTDGKFLFIPVEDASRTSPGRSLAIPVGPGETLPALPAGGIPPRADASAVSGATSVGRAGLIPGKDLNNFAWVNTTVQRNLYRISFP
jgi:Tol biopolymer transport system component